MDFAARAYDDRDVDRKLLQLFHDPAEGIPAAEPENRVPHFLSWIQSEHQSLRGQLATRGPIGNCSATMEHARV